MCFILIKDKQKALNLLKQKINGEIKITYMDISKQTGYEKRQLIRLSQIIEKKDIEDLLIHGLTGKNSNNSAPNQEIEYIKKFKNQYPNISISQFMDIYHEDVIFNPKMESVVKENGLVKRSKSFFQQLYKNEGWKSPIKHKCFKSNKDVHSLRDPMPRTGMLIMTDGTPYDWFETGELYSLHSTLDDATGKLCSGWFTKNECQFGYLKTFEIMFKKYGLPQAIYGDRTHILWTPKENSQTQIGRMLDELGIELIFALSSEAKGKIENKNKVVQNRLPNDIKRFNIKDYDELNIWFNDFYIDYINSKFGYDSKEEESEFVPLNNTDLTTILCIKEERTILNGNMFSYGNHYYIPINDDGTDYVFYKGTKIIVYDDTLNNTIKIFKNNKIYSTRKIEGQRINMEKKKAKEIEEQKTLERLFRERDERLKARAKRS
jgi:hypothetical protein